MGKKRTIWRWLLGAMGLALLIQSGAAAPAQTQCPAPTPVGLSAIPENIAILGIAPQAVLVEDINLDGRLDLVVSYLRCDPEKPELDPAGCREDDKTGRVILLLGQAAGGFIAAERAPRLSTGGEAPRFLTTGDFDGDCYPDLALSNFGAAGERGSVAVLINDQKGSFSSAKILRLEGNARGIVSADFDKDGKLDLAVTISNRRLVSVLKGDGQGKFDCCYDYRTGPGPQTVVAADFNGDGFADLATANDSSSNSVTILVNDQKGDFNAAPPLAVDDSPFDLAAGDLNKDGFLDIVTAHAAATDSLRIWLGDGKGGFAFKERFAAGADPIRVSLHDMNSDANLDALAINSGDNQISLLWGDGQGNLGAPASIPVGQTPISVAVRDLNRNGVLYLITANQSSHNITIRAQTPSFKMGGP